MGILQIQSSDPDIFTVGQIDQTRSLFLLVTAASPFPAEPAGSPCPEAVAVDGAGSAHGEVLHAVRIDQCHIIEAGLSLDPGSGQIIIRDIVAAF